MDILNILLARIKEGPEKAIIKVSAEEARMLFEHLNEYHRNKLPSFEKWQETMFFYGYKLKMVNPE